MTAVIAVYKLFPSPRGLQVQRIFTHFLTNLFHVLWYFRAIIFAMIAIIVFGAAVIALVEKLPFGEALYFSFVTGLTIGYGDIVAKTIIGRIVALTIGFFGIVFTGLVVAAAIRAVQETYKHK